MKKKVLSLMLVLTMAIALCACGSKSESGASDAGCLEALAFNWEDGNDQAANQSKWYAIDMREVMRSATRKDVEVNIVNKSDVVNPASIDICTLLLKPTKLQVNLDVRYCCKEIPDDFVVGFGLDYDGFGRNTKDIYTIVFSQTSKA